MTIKPAAMTVKQAAEYINVSESTMRKIIHRGDFNAAIHLDRKILINTNLLENWLNEQALRGSANE